MWLELGRYLIAVEPLTFVMFKTLDEWQHRKTGSSTLEWKNINLFFTRKLSSLDPILYIYFWSFLPSPTTVKRMALISLPRCTLKVHKCLFVPMPIHCTIRRFGFRARRIDGVECGLFSNHASLGQTTLRVGRVSV